jgi:NADH-quinone oxidoreductase subunit L
MKIAMAGLAVLAIVGGVIEIPKVTDVLHTFLAPSFADSRFYESLEPSDTLTVVGLLTGATLSIAGIALAYHLWVRSRGAGALRARLRAPAPLLRQQVVLRRGHRLPVVRPFAWFGRFGRNTFERLVITALFVGGTTAAVRAGSAAVRAVQSGYLRYYAALLLLGLTALGALLPGRRH